MRTNMNRSVIPADTDRRTATSAIELAIMLPFLMLAVFGCADFGRVMFYSIALENAVGSASDYAATHRFTDYTMAAWQTRVRERATEEMQGLPHFDSANFSTTIETTVEPGGDVRVTVTGTYPFQSAVDWPGLPTTVTLRHRVSSWQYR